MGIFDRFSGRKPEPQKPANGSAEPAATPAASAGRPVKPQIAAAREKLAAKDLPGAILIYEELLGGGAGDRADILVAISGDLGSHGHVAEIIELIAPRYDAERHGPATGLNLLQAYLAVRNADAAQHILDILFALNRPELEDRLHGFSNAIAELMASPHPLAHGSSPMGHPDAQKIGLITITKPIWFYGLEAHAAQILPPKESRTRRIAFAQLALPGYTEPADTLKRTEDELGRISRGLPLWFAETFYFSPSYAPIAAFGVRTLPEGLNQYVVFSGEWAVENLRQLVDSTEGGLDYIVTGALRANEGDYTLLMRIWDVNGFRERKTFTVRWTPATADTALLEIHGLIRTYMEWSPASAAFAYTVPTKPRAWLDTLAASLGLFLAEKAVIPPTQLVTPAADLESAAKHAAAGEAASFALLTMRARATKLGLGEGPANVTLARSPLVNQVQKSLG